MSSDRPDPERPSAPQTADQMRAAFDARDPLTIGLEEELMLLDPETFDLAPAGRAQLADARRTLLERAGRLARPAAAGIHPFSAAEGELNDDARYRRTIEQFGAIAHRQLVCALQVHVAVGGAQRTLAVYNALRSYLPELAALASAAPFYEGRDTGLASVRPKISDQLPRQGVPPPLETWESLADALRWGADSGLLPEHAGWWWELRPHPAWGTLELRVPDSQATVADAGAVAAVAHALVALLAGRHSRGEALPVHARWRIQENRWLACRDGVEGTLADLDSGEHRPTRERLHDLIAELEPQAGLGCSGELAHARELAERNSAMRQREVAAAHGVRGVAAWLADRFGDGL